MPIFELQTPDGKNFEVDAPDMQSAAGALGSMKTPPPSMGDRALGLAKAAGTGLEKGAMAVAGLPGDIGSGVDWAMNKITGASPEQQAKMTQLENSAGVPSPPTSQQIMGAAQSAGVPFHQAQNTPEKYAETIGSFVPSAMLGPGGAASKLGSAIAGGTASETAGQMTEGKPIEPYARFAGAVLGGGGATAIANRAATRAEQQAIPTMGQLQQAKNSAYKAAENSGVVISADQYDKVLNDVIGASKGVDSILTPSANRALDKMASLTRMPKTVQQLDGLRQDLRTAASSGNAQERTIAKNMVRAFDQSLDQEAPPVYAEARNLNKQYKRAELMDTMEQNAELKAGSKYTQSGMENALRKQYDNLAGQITNKNPKALQYNFSPDEVQAIRKVAIGGPVENTARWAGKFAPTSPVAAIPTMLGMIGGGGYLGGESGALGAAAIAGAGYAGKKLATALTKNNVNNAEQMIRRGPSGYSAYQAGKQQRLRDLMVRALLAGDASQATQP